MTPASRDKTLLVPLAAALLCGALLPGLITSRAALAAAPPAPAGAQTTDPAPAVPEAWAIHAQSTFVLQYHPEFASRIPLGPQSLDSGRRGDQTTDVTLFAGFRLWRGAEVWFNPEVDQGFGLQNTFGVAGYVSGEAFKLGSRDPYVRLSRGFLRQTIGLGGESATVEPDLNVLGGTQDANRVVLTIGKFSPTDVLDINKYAHDPRIDFMNWALIDGGAFDYASDAWGFTYGAAIEWYQNWWTLRAGLFDLTDHPGSEHLDLRPGHQLQAVLEAEERHTLFGQPGKLKFLLFASRGLMVRLNDFTREAAATGLAPDMSSLRHHRTRTGGAFNLEQSLTAELGMFVRLSLADGRYETFDFTDIDRSAAVGLSMKGAGWNRPDDVLAGAFLINEASRERLNFLRAGGQGLLIGDGIGFPSNAGAEQILETYYNVSVTKWLNLTLDYQLINHPAYNADRGPVHVFGFRLHAQI